MLFVITQRCSPDKLIYFNYIKNYGLHNKHILRQLSKEVKGREAAPLSWTSISCATRRAHQNQDHDQGGCICRLNPYSYRYDRAVKLLNEIPEFAIQHNNLYLTGLQYLHCTQNRRLFNCVLPNKCFEYLRLECKKNFAYLFKHAIIMATLFRCTYRKEK